MYSNKQCPKALAWMAALCAASGRGHDAQGWLVELIGVIVLSEQSAGYTTASSRQDTASMS